MINQLVPLLSLVVNFLAVFHHVVVLLLRKLLGARIGIQVLRLQLQVLHVVVHKALLFHVSNHLLEVQVFISQLILLPD